jgi:hypothetical protein
LHIVFRRAARVARTGFLCLVLLVRASSSRMRRPPPAGVDMTLPDPMCRFFDGYIFYPPKQICKNLEIPSIYALKALQKISPPQRGASQ